jgi:hypothetical protein
MDFREAFDWMLSEEAKLAIPDYGERWKAAARKTIEPLYERAHAEGLWFYHYEEEGDMDCEPGEHWWSPAELRSLQENEGKMVWWAHRFELRHPDEKIAELNSKLGEIAKERDEFGQRMADEQPMGGCMGPKIDEERVERLYRGFLAAADIQGFLHESPDILPLADARERTLAKVREAAREVVIHDACENF